MPLLDRHKANLVEDLVKPGDALRVKLTAPISWTSPKGQVGQRGPTKPGEYVALIIDTHPRWDGKLRDLDILIDGAHLKLDAEILVPLLDKGYSWRLSGRLDAVELLKPEV